MVQDVWQGDLLPPGYLISEKPRGVKAFILFGVKAFILFNLLLKNLAWTTHTRIFGSLPAYYKSGLLLLEIIVQSKYVEYSEYTEMICCFVVQPGRDTYG